MYRRDRSVHLIGPITHDSIARVQREIIEISTENPEEWVELYVSSKGGDIFSAMAFYDFITIFLRPELRTIACGSVESAALVVFCAGRERLMTGRSTILLHELKRIYEDAHLTEGDIKEALCDMAGISERINDILLEATDGRFTEFNELCKERTVLKSDHALEKGIAHRVVS